MATGYGRFAGKTAFGSTQGGTTYFLTTWARKSNNNTLYLPAMMATQATATERCILYDQGDGTLRIQLPSLLWISLDPGLGWLLLTADFAQAARFTLGGNPLGQTWQVQTANGPATVYYTVNNPSPILTINDGPGAASSFAPKMITPSLDQISQSKSGQGLDFQLVRLAGQSLNGIDLTGADFSQGDLTGSSLTGSTLTRAIFHQCTLTGITCDQATLDQADFTQANLAGVAWGSPASAKGLILTRASAAGATLGGQAKPLDCTGANLSLADLRGADLRGLTLTGCQAGGALLAGAKLDKAVLDSGNLTGAVLTDTSLRGASLRGLNGQGAIFVRADLTAADLTRAQLGAKAYRFTLPGSFAAELDKYPYPQADLRQAFAAQGITLAPTAPVLVVTAGSSWEIQDPNGPYDLLKNPAGSIDLFWASPDLRPAVLRDAICQGTIGSGASLSGADLRGVQWYSTGATLDHADLQGAVLSGALLSAIDFTQAYLDGADLSGSVLVQAQFRGCVIGLGESRQMLSLEGALLQGANFSDASLISALLVDAAVALPQGVPLFNLPPSASADLDTKNLSPLSATFDQAGYPLGSQPTVSKVQTWLLDNQANPDPSVPRSYKVQLISGQLRVYDGTSGNYLFTLPPGDVALLGGATAPPALVSAFVQAGYSLVSAAPITPQSYWEIRPSGDAPVVGAYGFPIMRVYPGSTALPVYGSVLVTLRDWDQFPSGLAFAATQGLESALNPASLGPSGLPRSWVEQGLTDWQGLMTAKR